LADEGSERAAYPQKSTAAFSAARSARRTLFWPIAVPFLVLKTKSSGPL
jgi:hypothetical protein